jgi:aryl-alcohol dehydrogenase-like predicted oxidoreductase
MKRRKLGTQGLETSAIGLGCMGMSWSYGVRDDAESVATLHEAVELGVDFFDTAEVYGPFENERLIGRAFKDRRDKVILATKFGFAMNERGEIIGVDSRPNRIKDVVDASLKRLDVEYVDVLYQHRVDPEVPIEDVVGAMSDLVKEGKVRYLGLSEAGAETVRRAHAVHPVSVVQTEYSLWEREVEKEILPTLRELGIGFVPYSPLGRGFLAGGIRHLADLTPDDGRRAFPRFEEENFQKNLILAEMVQTLAARRAVTPGQIALAWLLHQGEDIVPIPGTKRRAYLRENAAAVTLSLAREDLDWIESRFPPGVAAGARKNEAMMRLIDK